MAEKFRLAGLHGGIHPVSAEPIPWKPVHYFFYGSLMDEKQLAKVLRLDSPPVLRPASVVGYSIKMWGPYPTLVDGPTDNVVNGVVYEVQKEDHEKRLAYYETNAYLCVWCDIGPGTEGKRITGKTFAWAKGSNDRDLSEGSFDLEAWRKARDASA